MKKWQTLLVTVGGLFAAGIGAGMLAGWFGEEDRSIVFSVIAGLVFLAGIGAIWFVFRSRTDEDEDASELDMIFGDMSDPVQRNIILRVAIAGAIHGIALLRFLHGDTAKVTFADGLDNADWATLATYGFFVATLIWIAVECIVFHNIDEFWRRVAVGPAALAGVVLFLAVVCWMVAEDYLGAPQARFWWYYALYYFSAVGLLIGKWKLGKARG